MSEPTHSANTAESEQVHGWENEGGHLQFGPQYEELGITRMLTESFEVDGYRYTSLRDAIAQARRSRATA